MLVYSYVRTEPQSVIGHTRAKKVVIHHCVLAANFCLCFLVGLWSLFLSLLFLFWRNANLAGGSSWLGVCVMVLMSGRFTCDQLCPCDDVFTQFFSPADRASERCRPYRRKKNFYSDRKDQQMWKHFPCSLPNFEGRKGAIFSVLLLVHILDILMLPSHASSSF